MARAHDSSVSANSAGGRVTRRVSESATRASSGTEAADAVRRASDSLAKWSTLKGGGTVGNSVFFSAIRLKYTMTRPLVPVSPAARRRRRGERCALPSPHPASRLSAHWYECFNELPSCFGRNSRAPDRPDLFRGG